ncbi:CorA family divalent cation transporter [Faecalicatena contorta]|uniref:magnesium transporter CorA family protein n=1 Tax=Lachnospiraceae TaxID=186803 RepID=UPI001F2C7220|nr:CorA family divalent cation transporter [Faecalicatena contorta]
MRDSMKKLQFLTIIKEDEFRELKKDFPHDKELLHSIRSIRYCKAEVYQDCILGTLRVPKKNEKRTSQISCGFYMTDKELFLIECNGDLKHWIEKKEEQFQQLKSPDQFLLKMMEVMIENDLLYLLHLEKEIEKMEDQLIKNVPDDFFTVLTRYRQRLSELDAYYEQLTVIGDLLQSQDGISIICNTEQWNRYALRTERLQNHVQLLRENILQLRELYQSQQDAQQNKIMCILTVVTTLFLPLTLLTGWYGMNFVNMPELQWKYGYVAVIAIAVITIILELIYFKKKKLL